MSAAHVHDPSRPRPEVYLDNNATTRPYPAVAEAMLEVLTAGWGNPSSTHAIGARARRYLSAARDQVAALVGAAPRNVLFTAGATEANNLVLQNLRHGPLRGFRFVTTLVEHSSLLEPARGLQAEGGDVCFLAVDDDGRIDLDALDAAIRPGNTLVSIQWANNETGVRQPMCLIAARAKAAGAVVHSDAVQAVGKLTEVNLASIPLDLVSVSAHKFHGPQGVGALVGPGLEHLRPTMAGGPQERGLRPGTENLPGIVGFGQAAQECAKSIERTMENVRRLRDAFESDLLDRGLVRRVNGGGVSRLPNTANLEFTVVDGEALMLRLDQAGIRCSQSSACTNRRPEPSYVLRAMGRSEAEAFASIRFGFSGMSSERDVAIAVETITELHAQLAPFALA